MYDTLEEWFERYAITNLDHKLEMVQHPACPIEIKALARLESGTLNLWRAVTPAVGKAPRKLWISIASRPNLPPKIVIDLLRRGPPTVRHAILTHRHERVNPSHLWDVTINLLRGPNERRWRDLIRMFAAGPNMNDAAARSLFTLGHEIQRVLILNPHVPFETRWFFSEQASTQELRDLARSRCDLLVMLGDD